jgi:uncharacterized protein YukE
MSRSGAESQLSLSSTEEKREMETRVQKLKRNLNRKRVEDEEQDRVRKRKEQEKWEAEIQRCPISPPASEADEVAGAYHEWEIAYQPVRTQSKAQVASYPLTELPQESDSEITALNAEIVQLREELSRTKAQLKDIEDERDEVKKQQRVAASVDAQDEVARLKRRVENLDELLDQTTKELRRLRDQLRLSEDRIEELEGQVRVLRRQKQEENSAPRSNETVQSPSPQKAPQEKPGKLSASKKPHTLYQNTFLVTIDGRKKRR